MEWKVIAIATLIFLIFVALYFSGQSETAIESPGTTNETEGEQKTGEELEEELECLYENVTSNVTEVWGHAAIKVPAVDNEGNGVVTWLTVDVMPGKGRTLTDIDQLLFWVDTQYSIQIAKAVAASHTQMNLSGVDILYAIETEASLVEGQSAGAALTVATISALHNQTPNQNVMITGTINTDGSIGPVGGVLEKAAAAKDIGVDAFLVPKGQSVQITYRQERECERIGPITYCTTNYIPERTNIEEQVGINIEEVSNIGEALKYFIE